MRCLALIVFLIYKNVVTKRFVLAYILIVLLDILSKLISEIINVTYMSRRSLGLADATLYPLGKPFPRPQELKTKYKLEPNISVNSEVMLFLVTGIIRGLVEDGGLSACTCSSLPQVVVDIRSPQLSKPYRHPLNHSSLARRNQGIYRLEPAPFGSIVDHKNLVSLHDVQYVPRVTASHRR